jgi:hypothetical protein
MRVAEAEERGPHGKAPPPGKAERFFRGLQKGFSGFLIVQLLFIGVFVMVGPWWTVTTGLPGAAMLLAALGLLFDVTAFGVLLEWLPERAHRAIIKLSALQHLGVLLWGAWLVWQPVDPAWTLQPGTDGVSDPLLVFRPDGALVVHGGAGSVRWQGDDGGWYDLGAPGFFGWEFHAMPDGALYIGPREPQRIDRYDPQTETWRLIGRPAGALGDLAIGTGEIMAVIGGRLHRLDMFEKTWSEVHEVGRADAVALAPDGDGAFAAGSRWWWREGGEWVDVTPPGELGFPNDVYVGGGGWRYALLGGFMGGDMYVAGPGEGFRRALSPVGDPRVLVPDPVHGERVIVGSWGQGVWVSHDGGASWTSLGLGKIQVRSLAYDRRGGRLCAASSNLMWDKGVFCRELAAADRP